MKSMSHTTREGLFTRLMDPSHPPLSSTDVVRVGWWDAFAHDRLAYLLLQK